jgi:hypothetical protein
MDTPRINQFLKDYCSSVADWESKDWVLFVHGWWEKMSKAFGLETATPAIRIEAVRNGAAGRYQAGRNAFGLLHQLSIDPRRRDDPPALLLAALLREILREWHGVDGRRNSARYYNSALRARAAALGVKFDRRGRLLNVEPGPFTEFLGKEGVETSVFEHLAAAVPPPARPRSAKWSCACTEISAVAPLNIHCKDCGRDFQTNSLAPRADSVPFERDASPRDASPRDASPLSLPSADDGEIGPIERLAQVQRRTHLAFPCREIHHILRQEIHYTCLSEAPNRGFSRCWKQ